MKVLHIWNTAGVASIICKYQRKLGIDADVVMRKSHDPFGYTKYYKGFCWDMSGGEFVRKVLQLAQHYPIIHIHSSYKLARPLRDLYPDKKIILHHHGTDLTQTPALHLIPHYMACDEIITSTPDIHKVLTNRGIKGTLILNAVDTELFKPERRGKGALYISTRYTGTKRAIDFCGLKPHILDREKDYIHHHQMPYYLNNFDTYIDVKCPEWLDHPVQAYSKTGLESLACGLKVFNHKGEIVQGLPKEHEPEYMVKQILTKY